MILVGKFLKFKLILFIVVLNFTGNSMELSIMYFKGSQVEISELWCIYVMKMCFYLQAVHTKNEKG